MKFLKIISFLLIAFFFLFLFLVVFFFDFITSVTPGWHTTVYSPVQIAVCITMPWLLLAVFSYFIIQKNNRKVSVSTLRLYLLLTIIYPLFSIYFTIAEPSGTPRDLIRLIVLLLSFIVFLVGQIFLIFTIIKISRKPDL